jgi:glutamate-1-semialdehyde 2,1-aminomutase
MFSLFFHPGPVRNTKDVAKCDFDAFKHFFHTLLDHGIYTAPSQYETGFISLAHTEEILNKAVTQVDTALKDVFVPA